MNGVRRFLGGGATSTPSTPEPATPPALPATAPLLISGKPSWPPTSPTTSQSPASSPPRDVPQNTNTNTTAALFFRKDKARPPDGDAGAGSPRTSSAVTSPSARSQPSLPQSPVAGPSSPRAVPPRVSQLSRKSVGAEWKRSSQMINVRDDLLMGLLASEALVDSRGYDILSAEEVEELKKEEQVLSSRLVAMNRKLTLETKIRDAAASLSKANASYKNVSKQTNDQLDTANKKVDSAQKDLWRISERFNEVQRKLLEHRAGVLSRSVKKLEKHASSDETTTSGYSTPNGSSQMSPVTASSVTSIQSASSKGRFDGAHLFAGHADSVTPLFPKTSSRQANGAAEVGEKLQSANAALEAATTKQAEMEQELSLLHLEKEQIETSLGMELQNAQDTIASLEDRVAKMDDLEAQLQTLEQQQDVWEQERMALEEARREADQKQQEAELKQREVDSKQSEIDALGSKLRALEARSAEATAIEGALAIEKSARVAELEKKETELADVKVMWEADKAAWEMERAALMNDVREKTDRLQQDAEVGSNTQSQLDEYLTSLDAVVRAHSIALGPEAASPTGLVAAIRQHLDGLSSKVEIHSRAQAEWISHKDEVENNLRSAEDKQQVLTQELTKIRRERDEARAEIQKLETQLQTQTQTTALATAQAPSSLPPVEYKGDTASLVAVLQPIWANLPSAEARGSKLGSRSFRKGSGSPNGSPVQPSRSGSSLAELDVRSLKSLYDSKGVAMAASAGGTFTVEAFAERVQALIVDDRALVERLIRFAQAHDLLKKNAERAQKLAQDSNAALETYQKQVKTLEDRNISLMTQQAEMQEELQWLQETVERLQAEKLEIETHAAEQADTCAQLTEANNTLSAKALLMADEAASATDSVRKQLEAQLADANASLSKALEEVESMRQSQQIQQMAILEELNSVQTQNTSLRAQLRAKK